VGHGKHLTCFSTKSKIAALASLVDAFDYSGKVL